MTPEENRLAARAVPRAGEPVDVQLMSEGFLDIFEARDISATGLGLFVPYRFEGCDLKSPFDLVVTLPHCEPFLAKGRVVHRSKLERSFFGIEFVELRPESRRQIEGYVQRRLAEASAEAADPTSS